MIDFRDFAALVETEVSLLVESPSRQTMSDLGSKRRWNLPGETDVVEDCAPYFVGVKKTVVAGV